MAANNLPPSELKDFKEKIRLFHLKLNDRLNTPNTLCSDELSGNLSNYTRGIEQQGRYLESNVNQNGGLINRKASMLKNHDSIRFFAVSPPSLERVPRPDNVLFEARCSENKRGNVDKCVITVDNADASSNNGTSTDSNDNNNDSAGSSEDDCELPVGNKRRHSLTRRDFVFNEVLKVTRPTRTLDSYDLDVKLKVTPKYYQKWARNKRARSSSDAAVIQPFSMLVRQQNIAQIMPTATSNTPKESRLKRKRRSRIGKSKLNLERESPCLSYAETEYERLGTGTRKAMSAVMVDTGNIPNESKILRATDNTSCETVGKGIEMVENETNPCHRKVQTTNLQLTNNEIDQKVLSQTQEEPKAHGSIAMNTKEKCTNENSNITVTTSSTAQQSEISVSSKERKTIGPPGSRKVAFDIKSEPNVPTTFLTADLLLGISNRGPRFDEKPTYDGNHELPEHYGYYPSRPIFNDLMKRREKQTSLFSSDPISLRRTQTGTEDSLRIHEKYNSFHKGRVPVKLSKSSPRYSGPNNLFVDFETLRITAHLQKLEQYRKCSKSPVELATPQGRVSSEATPVQVIDRHGFKTVVLGYSVK